MSTRFETIRNAQNLVRQYAVEGSSWSEQLLVDRRLEYLGELEQSVAAGTARREVEENGFAVCEGLLPGEVAQRLIDALPT